VKSTRSELAQGSQNPARPRLSLVLCTDGLVEVFDSRDDTLGVEGFARLILDSAKLPLPEMRQAVLGGVAMPALNGVKETA